MKKTTTFTKLLMFSLVFFGLTSCSDDDDAAQVIENEPTTFEIIADSPDHTVLEEALIDTGLDQALNDGTYTVFAPTDEAFANVDITALSAEQLNNILLNHVVEGAAESADLSNDYLETLATESISGNGNNLSLYVNVDAGVMLNGVSSVTAADRSASNGVVHVVDAVIPIPDITTFAVADPNFENLEIALTRDDQPDFVGTLSATTSPAPFTVFAPTNNAFAQLLESTEFETLDDVPTDLLTEILNYHVIAEAYVSSSDLTSGEVISLGGTITIDADNATITDANGRTIQIEVTDVNTANGVIHAIDMVILPEIETTPSTFEIIANSPDHTVLEQLLVETGLDQALNDGIYTVFAPTDDAFSEIDASTLSEEELTNILLNHVVGETVLSTDLITDYYSTLATETFTGNDNNLSLYVNTEEGVLLNGMSNVSTADLEASNGVVHVVDGVLTIPDVTTFAVADPNFSTLVDALTRGDQPDFVEILSSFDTSVPLTVFAPTNQAFTDLINELDGVSSLDDIETNLLTSTLNNHVIAEANVTSDMLPDGTVETLEDDITIDAGSAIITDANGRTIQIILEMTDIQTGNGVIHAVDTVILPNLQ